MRSGSNSKLTENFKKFLLMLLKIDLQKWIMAMLRKKPK